VRESEDRSVLTRTGGRKERMDLLIHVKHGSMPNE
jgi:hypothetical protein